MFQFIFRASGMIVLALALVAAVLDLTRSIAASAFVITSFGQVWESISPGTLAGSRAAVETYLAPAVWSGSIAFLLSLPAFLVLWLLAMLLLWIGQRRHNPYGRFASR